MSVGFWRVAQGAREGVAGPAEWWTACIMQRLAGRVFAAHVRDKGILCESAPQLLCQYYCVCERAGGVHAQVWISQGAQ